MVNNIEQFYSEFFKNGEGIGFQSRFAKDDGGWWAKNHIRLQAPGMVSAIDFEYNNFCINPIDAYHDNNPENLDSRNKPRITNANVTAYRGMLIECDNLSPKKQTIRMNKSGMPYSTKVFSGNNSYHYVIFFDRDLTEEEYYATFDAIKKTLAKYNYVLDEQCKSPNKLTRAPFCKREITGAEQRLEEIKGLVKWEDMLKWLGKNHTSIKVLSKVIKERQAEYKGPGNADEKFRWEDAVRRNIYWNHEYGLTARQPWLFELGKQCKANGLDQATALRLAQENYEHDEAHKIASGINNGYAYGNLTPRTLNAIDELDTPLGEGKGLTASEHDAFVNDLRGGGYESVFRVNNDFFMMLPDGRHIPKTVSTLKIDFGTDAHAGLPDSNKFDEFTWIPNLLKDERIIIDKKVKKFNTFISPEWKIREGVTESDIPYSLHMMRRIFHGNAEDQYELGLDWVHKSFFDPTQKIPLIVLVGPTQTGKTEFAKHMIRIATGNMEVEVIGVEDLLGQFNSHSANSWFKCYDEVKMPKDDVSTNQIKRMITADKQKVEAKGKDAYYIDNYCRMMFTTNNMTDFLSMSETEDRYWVREVIPPSKEDKAKYTSYKQNLIKEIPDFISYIYYRGVKHEPVNEDRFWFDIPAYDTEALRAVKDGSKSDLALAVDAIIEKMFTNNSDLEIAYVRAQSVRDKIDEMAKFQDRKITNSTILKLLSDVARSTPNKMRRRDSIDGEELNTRFFKIKRSDIILNEITLPDFEEVKDVVIPKEIKEKKTTATNQDDYMRTRKDSEFFDIFDVDVPIPTN